MNVTLRGMGVIVLLVLPARGLCQETGQIVSFPHHSFSVLRATVPTGDAIRSVNFSLTKDGETLDTGFGLPRPHENFRSTFHKSNETDIVLVAVGRWGMGAAEFVFDEPGTWHAKWTVGFEDPSIAELEIMQTLEVEPMVPQDGRFLARISDVEWLRRFLGAEFHEPTEEDARQWFLSPDGADHRALIVIGKILEATQYGEPMTVGGKLGSVQRALQWGDALWELAQDIPDSSYAPYAAFYAGCCYMAGVGDAMKKAHGTLVTPLAKEHPLFGKADAALAFAVERGDPYLQPRAIHNQAFLFALAADWNKTNEVLKRGYELTGTRGTARSRLESLDEQIQKARAEFTRKSEPDR